jgi:hypothetical protein
MLVAADDVLALQIAEPAAIAADIGDVGTTLGAAAGLGVVVERPPRRHADRDDGPRRRRTSPSASSAGGFRVLAIEAPARLVASD